MNEQKKGNGRENNNFPTLHKITTQPNGSTGIYLAQGIKGISLCGVGGA